MKWFRRKRRPQINPPAVRALLNSADQLTTDVNELIERVGSLEDRMANLERGRHGHCLGCGDTTGDYSQTHCGRVSCEEAA